MNTIYIKKMLKFSQKTSLEKVKKDKNKCPFLKIVMKSFAKKNTFFHLKLYAFNTK